MAKVLTLENALSDDRKPIKVDDESTGLLLSKNKASVEGELETDSLKVWRGATIDGLASIQACSITNTLIVGGTIGVGGDVNIDGDLQVDGDDIKCDGAMNLEAEGGSITLDSSTGSFPLKKDGTEFIADMYAGMILGYTRLEGDLTSQQTYEIQNSMTVEDASHKVTFKTPPSEIVEIEATYFINAVSTDTRINVGLSDSDTYNAVAEQFEYDGNSVWFTDDEINDTTLTSKFVLSASHLASIGSSNTFYIGFSTDGATKTAYLSYGLRASHGIADHPFTIKATALPASIYDGS